MPLSTPYISNAASPIGLQDVGIKISLPGVNAKSASSTQLIFDSSWPSIATVFTFTGTLPATNQTVTVPHNLGFAPFAKVWFLDANKNIIASDGAVYGSYAVDVNNFYLIDSTTPAIRGTYFYVNLYNIDLAQDIDYPVLPTSTVSNFYDKNFGIKVTKERKSANSKDARDYILHSRYRSPLIQAVKTEKTMNPLNSGATKGAVQYVNASGTPTWNYGFVKVGPIIAANNGITVGSYKFAPYYAQSYPVTTTDGITTYVEFLKGPGDLGATIVVLRDPFFAPTFVQAFY